MKIEKIEMFDHFKRKIIKSVEDVLPAAQLQLPTVPKKDKSSSQFNTYRCWNYGYISLFKTIYTLSDCNRASYDGCNEPKTVSFGKYHERYDLQDKTFFNGHQVLRSDVVGQSFIIMDKMQTLNELKDFVINQEPEMKYYFEERQNYYKNRPDLKIMDEQEPILMQGWEYAHGLFPGDQRNFYHFLYEYIPKNTLMILLCGKTIVIDKKLNQLYPTTTGQKPVELLNIFQKTQGVKRL